MNVWGGAHHRAGNAPRYHYSITATYITELFSFLFPFSSLFFLQNLSSSPALTAGLSAESQLHISLSHQQHATNTKAARALTVTLWFRKIALGHRGNGNAAMKRPPPHSALLKSTTSFVNVANKRWNKESRSRDANEKLT